MTNQVQLFQSPEFGEFQTLEIDGKVFFPATRSAEILGYQNPRDAIVRHCRQEGVVKHDVFGQTGRKEAKFIDEGNLYRLITHSKLPSAERFEKWVFDEVLPSIRKNGFYSVDSQNIEVQKQAFDADIALIKSAGNLAEVLTQHFGVEEGIARTSVLDMIEDRFNRDFSKIKQILPPSKSKSALLTPTQIGEQFDPAIKPYNVNLWLEHCNLQINIAGKWNPTELGKQFAFFVPFTNKKSKHSDLQPKWKLDVIDFLRQHPCPMEILQRKPSPHE